MGCKEASGAGASVGASAGAPNPNDDDKDHDKNTPQKTYKSIKNSPKYPKDFKAARNGTTSNNINNQKLLEQLRKIEQGKWQKIYKDGYNGAGKKVSIHYFKSPSGRVFDVKVKPGWSNSSSWR